MRAGRFRNRVQVLKRRGLPPTWTECCTMSVAFSEPKSAQSGGGLSTNIGGVGLRKAMPFLVTTRARLPLEAGLLIRCKERVWSVDSRAQVNERQREYVYTCREFEAVFGTYHDASTGAEYPVRAQEIQSNVAAQLGFQPKLAQITIEMLLLELRWPYAQKGDRVTVQGTEHLLDGSSTVGFDGYTLIASTIHTPPAAPVVY